MKNDNKFLIFDEDEINELEYEIKNYNTPNNLYSRLIAIKLLNSGFTHDEIADILCVSTRTINRWVDRYIDSGLDSLKPKWGDGRPPQMSKKIKENSMRKYPNIPIYQKKVLRNY